MTINIKLSVNPGSTGWKEILLTRKPHKNLTDTVTADYLIIGSGFDGLSAARRLNHIDKVS